MIRDLIKWVVPGLATVLAGTTLCVAMTSADMVSDLSAKGAAAMAATGNDWAELSFDTRDLTLSGTTTDELALQAAIDRLDGIAGIRSVVSEVTLAPLASPYLFTASIAPEGRELLGAVPDETTRQRLLDRAGLQVAALELRSGMPERGAWTAGAQFAIDNLKYLDQGEISVADTMLNLSGRAKSERDYRDLLIVMRAGPPAGIELGSVTIVPPLVAPYHWNATSDGKRIEVTGFVPDDAMAERLRMADVSGLPVATGLTLGSGEPDDFATLSQTLLEQLAKLEYGSAAIDGDQSTLTGAPPSVEIAQAVIDTLQSSGSIVVLEPPRIADYWMSATRQAGGVIVFDGYAPDEATRDAFAQHEGADTSYLNLGRGATERYQSAADFGLAALDLMSEGRFALRDNILTISGIAASAGDYATLQASLADGAPQGLVLAQAEIQAPRASAYEWQVSKDGAGGVTLSGLVPSPTAEAALLAVAGPTAKGNMTYASGEPGNFLASAETALDLLAPLHDGTIRFDGSGWTLTGTANSAADRTQIETDFAARQLAAAGWSMSLAQAPVAVAETAPAPEVVAAQEVEPPVVAEPVPEPVAPPVAEPLAVAEAAPVEAIAEPAAQDTEAPEGRAAVELEAPPVAATSEPAIAEPVAAEAVVTEPVVAETVEPPDADPEPAAPSAPAGLLACAAPVAQFSARNAIFFQSGAANIARESEAALDELAIDLAACPTATVHVEGHTDADGDEALNMALSVGRAEAVVNALVLRGVAAERLYAVGYGESAPIADNTTPQGKRINRRIVVTVKAGD